MWKRQYISKDGETTLIRIMLLNLPLYLMSILPLPRNFRLRLDQTREISFGEVDRWSVNCTQLSDQRYAWIKGTRDSV